MRKYRYQQFWAKTLWRKTISSCGSLKVSHRRPHAVLVADTTPCQPLPYNDSPVTTCFNDDIDLYPSLRCVVADDAPHRWRFRVNQTTATTAALSCSNDSRLC